MKSKNFLSNLCDSGWIGRVTTLNLTVGSPSVHRRHWMKKLYILFIILCSIGVGNVWGADVTINANQITGFGNGTQYASGSITIGDITIASNGGFSTTQFRVAKSKTMTISTSVGKITKIVVNCSSRYKLNDNTNLNYSGTAGTYTNAEGVTSITFTNSNANIARITSIDITYTAGGTSHTLSSAVSPAESGSVELSATSVAEGSTATATATPAAHYVFDHWSISGTGSTLSNTTANPTTITMGTANTTVTATFVAAPKASVTLSEAGATTTDATTYYVGDSYTLPSSTGASCGTKVLVGWSTVEVAETDTKPASNFYEKGETVTLEASQTFYAVFANASGGGGGAPIAYTAGDEGTYVLAIYVNDTWYALPANPTVTSGKISGVAITVSNTGGVDYVTSANALGFEWTIANATNGQTISDGSNYIYHKNGGSSGTDLTYGNGTTYTWTIASEQNGLTFKGTNGNTVNSRGLLASGTTFGGYALSNEDASGYYRIHVLPIGGGTTYSAYSTSCVACANNVTISQGSASNGTFTLSATGAQPSCAGAVNIIVTPSPEDGYRVVDVTATAGSPNITDNGNGTWTVSFAQNTNVSSTINVSFEAIPTYTITLDPSAPANGTTYLESAGTTSVTLDEGIICNLWTVPNDCYSLSSINITPADGYSELEANGENQWEILGITKNLSVAVVYAQRAQYTVTLDAGTGSVTGPTSFTQSNCGNIELPAASPSDACATDGWEFAGWSRTKVNTETTSAPVLIPAGSFAPTATETLYAVYKQGSGAAESYWVKVKDDSKLAAGDSVIIAAHEYGLAMSTTQNTNNRGQASITKSTNGDTLTAISANVDKFILSAGSVSGTFSFYDPTSTIGYLCAASSSKNYLRTQGTKDANGSWTISINSTSGVATITAQGSNTNNLMRYNSVNYLFSCYDSGQKTLCLYTKAMGSANTYFSSPSCTPCVSAAASLSSSAISMTTGKSSVITLTSDNTSEVTATSSNTEVATVSVSGKNITVNGIAEGEATVIIQQVRDGVDASAHCEVYFEVSISVTTATIEIIEWEREAVTIEYDGDPTASVILGKEVEHGSKDAKVATDLFFSKYFEAAGEDKLLGIFNGTPDTIDLSKYTIKNNLGGNDALTSHALTPYGNTPGKIAPQEEIILYRFGQSGYSRNCIQNIEGHEKWKEIIWEGMKFSGRYSIGLYKKDRSNNDSIIDIIGATYSQAVGGHSKGDLVLLNKVGGGGIKPSWGDDSGFNAEGHGDNISTDDLETNYGLSTNRCLLVRKNTVTSGADAVRLDTTSYNPNTEPAKCAAAFQTLRTEWGGVHVPEWEDKKTATCNGMGYVAGFNYSDYYVTMETFSDNQTIGGYGNGDGTYTIPLPHLDTLACRLIRIQLAKEGNVIASSDPKVPIVVDADMSTNSKEFYKHSIDTCKVCDVVVRDKATLTKATTGAANDRAELQNITVYSGSHLVIPSGATDLRAKSIVLRSLDDTVSTASYTGGMTFKDKGYRVYHSKRVKQDRWYWISLPYTCSTSKITWQDGTKATIGTDFHLKYYDGAQRAATQQGGCWKEYTGSTIQPGVGYILSVEQRVGHTYRELIFPMDTISEGEPTKGVPVDDYGAGESITPNHKGWNLVGNPYMTYYQKNKINAGDKNLPALTVGKLIPRDSIDAANPLRTIHTYTIDVSGNNNAPFITVPKDQGNSEYEQKLIMDYDLPPFISYFVQIGNNTPVATQQYVNFAQADLTNTPSNLLHASYVRKRAVEEEVDPLESVLVTLRMKNHEQEADETTFIISDQYSADYEIGSDLGKWFGDHYKDYTKPVLYSKAKNGDKLVFYSLPDASAAQWIPLGFWGGNVTQPITFSLRRNNRKLDYVESVILHDKTMNIYTELLENDYSFTPSSQTKLNGSRFEVKVILNRPKADVPTGTDNIIAGLYAYASGSQKLTVVGLPEKATIWIYDALGRLIINEDTSNYMRTYDVQGTGVYFVRVNSAGGQQTLRTIVK